MRHLITLLLAALCAIPVALVLRLISPTVPAIAHWIIVTAVLFLGYALPWSSLIRGQWLRGFLAGLAILAVLALFLLPRL